jgi:hypothetical protein
MKDPGNKGAGLASLAKALGELGATFEQIGAKQKAEAEANQEAMATATAYADATVGDSPAGASGQVGPGTTVKERQPTWGDTNNWNSPTHSKIEIRKRQISAVKETEDWMATNAPFDNLPYETWSNPEMFERHGAAMREEIIKKYGHDRVMLSAALERFDGEMNKARTRYGHERVEQFKKDDKEHRFKRLEGVLDDTDLDDDADISSLDMASPPTSAYKTRGRAVVPAVQDAVKQVAGDTWLGDFMVASARVESSGGRNVTNPNSSARGPWQFIESTGRRYGLNSERARLDPYLSAQAMAKLTLDNQRGLRKALGRDPSFSELYLAHQQGLGGALKLLTNPSARAVDIVGSQAVKLNGGKQSMTAKEFAGLWLKKFNKINGLSKDTAVADANIDPASLRMDDKLYRKKQLEGIQIASNDPNFMPQMGGEEGQSAKDWVEERYGADKDEGEYKYETPVTEYDYTENEQGERVADVTGDPEVLRLNRKILEIDADEATSSPSSPAERRDDYFKYVQKKVQETGDAKWFDAIPKQWLTQEQRAEITKAREDVENDKYVKWKRGREMEEVRKKEQMEEFERKTLERIQAGEDVDPLRDGVDENGRPDPDKQRFIREQMNQPNVPSHESVGTALNIEADLIEAYETGNFEQFGIEGTPDPSQINEMIRRRADLNPAEKVALQQRVQQIAESTTISNSRVAEQYFEDQFGDMTRVLTQSFTDQLGKGSPEGLAVVQGIGKAQRMFKKELQRQVDSFIEQNSRRPSNRELNELLDTAAARAEKYIDKVINDSDRMKRSASGGQSPVNPTNKPAKNTDKGGRGRMPNLNRTVKEDGTIVYTRPQATPQEPPEEWLTEDGF